MNTELESYRKNDKKSLEKEDHRNEELIYLLKSKSNQLMENFEKVSKDYASICTKYFNSKEKNKNFSELMKENKSLMKKIETLENFKGFDKLAEKELNYYEEIYLKVIFVWVYIFHIFFRALHNAKWKNRDEFSKKNWMTYEL